VSDEKPLTVEEIDEGLLLADEATPGPWTTSTDHGTLNHVAWTTAHGWVHSDRSGIRCAPSADSEKHVRQDAKFIAAAREGWPRALLEVTRQRQAMLTAMQALENGDTATALRVLRPEFPDYTTPLEPATEADDTGT